MAVFSIIVGLQLLVGVISIDVMSSVRAYVEGESLYSKGQKDAQVQLMNYAERHEDEDYRRFLRALDFPLGDRIAREALQKDPPDLEAARQGLLQGGTFDGDIPGVLRLFRAFHETPLMSGAIAAWTEGDRLIEQLRVLVENAHDRIAAGDEQAPEVSKLRSEGAELNRRLTDLELQFGRRLGDGARLAERLLLGTNLALALLLGLTGLAFVLRSTRLQVATENEVRRRQESLQGLLDSAAEGLYGTDTEGRCTFINRAALEMLGYQKESQLLGRLMDTVIRHSHADGSARPMVESFLERSGREHHVVDEVLWRPDGTSFPVEYWSHAMVEDSQVTGVVVTFFDIRDRLAMQAALRQGEVRIAGLVDAVNDGVMTIDAREQVILFNRAAERLFGVPAREAIGSNVERFIPLRPRKSSNGGKQELDDFDDVPGGGSVRELTGLRSDGQEFPLEVSLSRVQTEHGTLVTAVLRDATDLQNARVERQARQVLEAAGRAKTEFLSRMSHELRTPLNAVLGFSQLLRLNPVAPPTPQQLGVIRQIEVAANHLLALVNDVLDLSRVDSGNMMMFLETLDLASAVEDAVSMTSALATPAGVEIAITGLDRNLISYATPHEGAPAVIADRVRLRQVLVNLLSNAIKYNRPGGAVRISWQICDGQTELRVKDDGYGMSPDKLERLFEPFNRLGAERSKIEGTGIGLVLSRRLVELMGGELRIESAVDRGTVAFLRLDSSDSSMEIDTVSVALSAHGSMEEPFRVLYAEDNEVNVEIVRGVLLLRPSIVLEVAYSGAEARAKARRNPPHLMLVDMTLGDTTGVELARALRADPVTASIPLIALSADALPEQIDWARSNGFENYVTKPIDFKRLLAVLDEARRRLLA